MCSKCMAASDRDSALAFLRKCFTPQEWSYLCQQSEFTDSLGRVQTLNDAEGRIIIGLEMLGRATPTEWDPSGGLAEAA